MKKSDDDKNNVFPISNALKISPFAGCPHRNRLQRELAKLTEELPELGAGIKIIQAKIIRIGNQEYLCSHKPPSAAIRERLEALIQAVGDLESVHEYIEDQLVGMHMDLNGGK